MRRSDQWPFTPVSLSDIINKDLLEIIASGFSDRFGRVFTLLDQDTKIDAINYAQRYEGFCAVFRDENRVQGGNRLCEQCDTKAAEDSLEWLRTKGDPLHSYQCHMGLQEGIHVIQVQNQPVAFLFSGQYRPDSGVEHIQEKVESLGTGDYSNVNLNDDVRLELLIQADALRPPPEDYLTNIREVVDNIQWLAEAEHHRRKTEQEQAFLEKLRDECSVNTQTSEILRQIVGTLLEVIAHYCGCTYTVFFTNINEGDTVLYPLASFGIPANVQKNFPHFNWKKAGLPLDEEYDAARHYLDQNFDLSSQSSVEVSRAHIEEMKSKGIRGSNSDFFSSTSSILPTSLNTRRRGVLVLGPFIESVDPSKEMVFLLNICNVLSSYIFVELEIHHLEEEREQWRRIARMLIHQVGTELVPIMTQIGRAKFHARRLEEKTRVIEFVEKAEDLCQKLSESTRKTLESTRGSWEEHAVAIEPNDLDFEPYPLSALIINCVEGFSFEAEKKNLKLALYHEEKVETLPYAEIDIARLPIAINNLLSNAIKYSFPNTEISVNAGTDALENPLETNAVITIQNTGFEIRQEEMDMIFEPGVRVLQEADQERIPGSGLGLWETRLVLRAHGGQVGVACERVTLRETRRTAHRVTFTVKFPLQQKRKSQKGDS